MMEEKKDPTIQDLGFRVQGLGILPQQWRMKQKGNRYEEEAVWELGLCRSRVSGVRIQTSRLGFRDGV